MQAPGLDNALRRAAHTGGQLLQFCVGVAAGMACLARRKFVHRDLASHNVLLDSMDTAKVRLWTDHGAVRQRMLRSVHRRHAAPNPLARA